MADITPSFKTPYDAMLSLVGLKETPGPDSNPRILAMAKEVATIPDLAWIGTFYKDDQIPWCGLAMAWAAMKSGSVPPRPNPLSALRWKDWGFPLGGPKLGAVCVLSRGQGFGHVGLVSGVARDGSYVSLLGGNESDEVRFAAFATKNVIAYRRPVNVDALADAPILGATAQLSEASTR